MLHHLGEQIRGHLEHVNQMQLQDSFHVTCMLERIHVHRMVVTDEWAPACVNPMLNRVCVKNSSFGGSRGKMVRVLDSEVPGFSGIDLRYLSLDGIPSMKRQKRSSWGNWMGRSGP